MPLARIEVCRHWDDASRARLMQEVALAVAEAFAVETMATKVVFVEHPRTAFALPQNASDRRTIVQIDMYPWQLRLR